MCCFWLANRPDARQEIHMLRFILPAFAIFITLMIPAKAGEADVLSATLTETAPGVFTISAEVEHGDDGWDHYANAWQVIGPDGSVIATRVLAHPHMNEQPFIRVLTDVSIPDNVSEVTIRARDLVHGFGGRTVTLTVRPAKPAG